MSRMGLPHVAQRMFNVPLMITEDKAEVILAAIAERVGVEQLVRPSGAAVAFDDYDFDDDGPADSRPYAVLQGVAVIPVCGTLVNKLGSLRPYSGMTGYDGIRANLSMALEDEEVRAVVFDIESPGGEVAGCFDLVDDIYAARGSKPMTAILTEYAYSAGYALASAVDPGRIYVPRTGGTGSVGVIVMLPDMSKGLKKSGVTVNVLRSDEFKAETNPYEPLTDGARARVMAEVDEIAELFRDTVARNRGMAASKVKEAKAGCFLGARGVEFGFADAVMAPNAAFRALLDELG